MTENNFLNAQERAKYVTDLAQRWARGLLRDTLVIKRIKMMTQEEKTRFLAIAEECRDATMKGWEHPEVFISAGAMPEPQKAVPDEPVAEMLPDTPAVIPATWEVHKRPDNVASMFGGLPVTRLTAFPGSVTPVAETPRPAPRPDPAPVPQPEPQPQPVARIVPLRKREEEEVLRARLPMLLRPAAEPAHARIVVPTAARKAWNDTPSWRGSPPAATSSTSSSRRPKSRPWAR